MPRDRDYYRNAANHPDSRGHSSPYGYDTARHDWEQNGGVRQDPSIPYRPVFRSPFSVDLWRHRNGEI